jgi:hypothetical protein
VGFSRDKFLYALKWWEIKAIIDGYRKRERTYLLMTRWSTFMIMSTGMADLSKAGIKTEKDLIRFSWEESNMFTKEELAELDKLLKGSTDQ